MFLRLLPISRWRPAMIEAEFLEFLTAATVLYVLMLVIR
jgi:hypothetical protein